jgi:acyl-CoA thioesterase FadM
MRAVIDYVCIGIDSGRPRRLPEAFVRAHGDDVRSG